MHHTRMIESVSEAIKTNLQKNEKKKYELFHDMSKDYNKAKVKVKHTADKRVTNLKQVTYKLNEIYVQPYQVQHDRQISEFTKHIYKQSLNVFASIKEKTTDAKVKKEIDFLAQSYEDKFGEFVRETQKLPIKTRLGRQKVIINTLETSNRILNRLVNYLIGRMGKNVLRNEVAANVFQHEINKKMEIEKNHICKKFSICRSQDGCTNFMVDVIDIVLSADDNKIIQIRDALTEVLTYTDYSNSKNPLTEKNIKKAISNIDKTEITELKPRLYIMKNILVHKNKPIEVVGEVDERVNKTLAFLEMVDAMENALPPNEENRLSWSDLKNSLQGWKDSHRKDIVEITQSVVDHFKKGMQSFDHETALSFERNFNLICEHKI